MSFGIKTCILMLSVLLMLVMPLSILSSPQEEHVYYGYIPISRDMGAVDELISGKVHTYEVPPSSALLDIIAIYDNTNVEVYDISAMKLLDSFSLNKFELKTIPLLYGTFFKVVTNKRVLVHICGGYSYCGVNNRREVLGDGGFYPSLEGGFRGSEFIFLPETVSDSFETVHRGSNLIMIGLTNSKYSITDSSGTTSLKGEVSQRKYKEYFLACRIFHGAPAWGAGNSMIFSLKSDGDVFIASGTTASFMVVPSITGGFFGKLFLFPVYISITDFKTTGAIMIVPIEPCKVSIYDAENMKLLAEREFSTKDIEKDVYWFYTLGHVKKLLFIKSTGKIVVFAGSTVGEETPENFGDDVTFLGIKAGEKGKFYVPEVAIIFAPEDCTITLDGKEIRLRKDGYMLIDKGVHRISTDKLVIIEILSGAGVIRGYEECQLIRGWGAWGSYLIESLDVIKKYEVPKDIEKGITNATDMKWYYLSSLLIAIGAAISVLFYRRRKGK